MTTRVLVIGGYGNFGRFISKMLAQDHNITLIIAGRDEFKARELAKTLDHQNEIEYVKIDIHDNFCATLSRINPDIVIHTSGPFQGQGYHVAEACIIAGCHYIDLADARGFVANIGSLNNAAKEKNILVCSGASSVPCLTSAIIDQYLREFSSLGEVEYGIATAQLTNRGLATTSAVLSYAGKPFKALINGEMRDVFGWLDLRFRNFWGLNNRPLGNCDIPDLEIFPTRYPTLKTIRFYAGLELKFLHILLWLQSWLVKLKILSSLQPFAPYLLKISRLFDVFGKDDSGFFMKLSGTGRDQQFKVITFDLVARQGDGLYIPVMPAILMAKKIAAGEISETGAYPCVGFITLEEYLDALSKLNIEWKMSD